MAFMKKPWGRDREEPRAGGIPAGRAESNHPMKHSSTRVLEVWFRPLIGSTKQVGSENWVVSRVGRVGERHRLREGFYSTSPTNEGLVKRGKSELVVVAGRADVTSNVVIPGKPWSAEADYPQTRLSRGITRPHSVVKAPR